MKNRILTVIAVATLISAFSGCGQMRNFLFGRGARCGNAGPIIGNGALINRIRRPLAPRQVPVAANQYAPTNQLYVAPQMQGCPQCNTRQVAPQLGCGIEAGCGLEAGCGHEMIPQCNCGVSNYGPVTSNYGPHVSGSVINEGIVGQSYPMEGTVIGSPIVGGQVIGGSVIGSDNFYPRGSVYNSYKVDQDGHRILSEDPLPPGATPLN